MADANSIDTSTGSATTIPPGIDPATRYSEAMKSLDAALGHWFMLRPDMDILGKRDVSPDDVRLSADFILPTIDMSGDVAQQVLAALAEMRDTITEAETLFRAALDAGEVDTRPIIGYVAAVDGKPICEPTDEHTATMTAYQAASDDVQVLAVFEDGTEAVVDEIERVANAQNRVAAVEGGAAC